MDLSNVQRRRRLPRPATVTRTLLLTEFLLILLSLGGQLIRYGSDYDSLLGLVDKFYVDNENNIPTYFSGLLLLFGGFLLGLIALMKQDTRDPFRVHWKWLALLFVLLSLDEIASIHEMSIHPIKRIVDVGGFFFFAWVVPGLLFVAAAGLYFLRFVFSLPTATRSRVIVAGIVYLAGSMGVEMLGGHYYEQSQRQDFVYSLIVTLEEALEMTGVILFIHALLIYLSERLCGILLLHNRPSASAASRLHQNTLKKLPA